MKQYSIHDGNRMPIPLVGNTTIYVSSGTYYENGMTPTDRQQVTISLIGPPEEIDRIMEGFGIAHRIQTEGDDQ